MSELPVLKNPTEEEIEKIENEVAQLDPPWVLTRADAHLWSAERRSGTHAMTASAVTARALKKSINSQLAAESASKPGYSPTGPSIIQGEVNTEGGTP
jgi:hypothetical protein